MRKLVVLGAVILSFATQAGLESFNNRFEFVREDGKLIAVRDRSLSSKFSIKTYISYIKNELLKEQALMNSFQGDYENEIKNLFSDGESLRGENNERVNHIVNSMKALGPVDFEAIFSNENFVEVMESFEGKLREAIFYIDPQLVAKPDNASFFYKRNVTHKVVSWALNFAAKKLSTVPLLNTASYAIVQIEKMMTTRRMYQQNMLLHYLEVNEASELGLTKEEADSIFSSIYESRIEWYAFWESTDAKLDWTHFGSNRFYQNWRLGTNKIRSFKGIYDSMDERVNFAFNEVTYKGERVLVNLVNNQNMIDSKPAIAYSFDNPKKIKRTRAVLTLARLGLSFVSLPAMIKDIVQDYMKSYYEQQQITEGALMAYFEQNDMTDEAKNVRSQFINPYSF
ncbi:hypothetical protein [Bacteriovorax sp. Seq25_V]|uniref:hypothetical protein n=1 Tax=Bacteriovorax sp. Seq25_V TaxID=1201288 RepID=UPI000389F2AE|nr:hypothetical protein [Bacteriovorax sp. Seq25_V]EQC48037.1 hypothetical protein M900_1119 [Bacteriovorax sp. Seq25_V]